MKRKLALTFLVGAGVGLTGCQSPMLGGLSSWNRGNSSVASTSPDVNKQRFSGLSQQADQQRAMGQSNAGTAAIGAGRPVNNDGILLASWKKTTAAVSGAVATKPKVVAPEDDPLSLDKMPKKINSDVYIGAARLLENQGKYAEAEGKYQEALRSTPGDVNAMVGLARLHDRQGQSQKAIDAYTKAAQANPTSALVFNDLGLCYRRQRQLDKSLSAFRKAVDLQPDNTKYRNNLAASLVDAGRPDDAFQELAAGTSAAVAHYNLAFLLQQKGDKVQATRHLQEALALDAGLQPARDMLAQLNGGSPAAVETASATATNAAASPRMVVGSATQSAVTAHTQWGPAAEAAAEIAQVPARQLTPAADPALAYESEAAETNVYTAPPQVAAMTAEPPSYHIGDDASAGPGNSAPAAETASRSKWGSAAWVLPGGTSSGSHPLPPVE